MQDTSTNADARPEGAKRRYPAPTISLTLEPEGKTQVIDRPKTVLQLMNRLNIRPCTCLFIKRHPGGEKELLTPDRQIFANDDIVIRTVVSSG